MALGRREVCYLTCSLALNGNRVRQQKGYTGSHPLSSISLVELLVVAEVYFRWLTNQTYCLTEDSGKTAFTFPKNLSLL